MTKKERELLRKAISHLMSDNHEWDEGLSILVKLVDPLAKTPIDRVTSCPSHRTVDIFDNYRKLTE
jgi:hypothetical protein